MRIDKLIRNAALANSNNEAGGRLRAGAVSIDGETVGESNFIAEIPLDHWIVLRVGRRIKKVRLIGLSGGQ